MVDMRVVAGVGGAGALALVCARCCRKKKKKVFTLPPQEEHPRGTPQTPGGGAPVFTGIRVVELANTVAGPLAARVLGELGAEVVKVEDESGDYWRRMLLDYEPGRPFGTSFEHANLGKSSVVLNLKKASNVSRLKKMLSEADVFVTNLRLQALQALKDEDGKGLDYQSLRKDCPHLVYAHLTAWGLKGPDALRPGYDLGAFWTMTGMSAMFHAQGTYTIYPFGFGDTCTASHLVAGIGVALRHRCMTGEGHMVESSLLRSGLWCLGPWLAEEYEKNEGSTADVIPTYHQHPVTDPLWATYRTQDGRHVVLCGGSRPVEQERALREALRLAGVDAEVTRASLLEAFSGVDLGKVLPHLRSCSVEHTVMPAVDLDMVKRGEGLTYTPEFRECSEKANCFVSAPGCTDVKRWIRVPFDVSCSAQHGEPQRRAPILGAHTESFLSQSWAPRAEGACLPKPTAGGKQRRGALLKGTNVVELSGFDVSCASVAAQLADMGCSVRKIEHGEGGDVWRKRSTHMWRQLNRGKDVVRMPDLKSSAAELRDMVFAADLFITNVPQTLLAELDLDYESVHRKAPKLVYAQQTAWGIGATDANGADITAWWSQSGLAAGTHYVQMADMGSNMPCQLGSVCSSTHLLAAVTTALFHQQRTGEGQRVDVNHLRSGLWSTLMPWGMVEFEPAKLLTFKKRSGEEFRKEFPVPTANSFMTRDGMWVQLLGVDFAKHISGTFKALGIQSAWFGIIRTVVWECIINKKGETKVEQFTPMFRAINSALERAIGSMTWEEFKQRMDKAGGWYCHVNMLPQALADRQSHAVDIFTHRPEGLLVNTPIQFAPSLDEAYSPGDHNMEHGPGRSS